MNPVDLYRGEIFYLTDSPLDKETFYTYIADGALVVSEGHILESGPYSGMWQKYPQAFLHDYSGMIIMPGMIDAHIHFPQLNIVGMYGKKLLDWLNNYTFPSEKDFNDSAYSDYMAEQFVNTLFRNGTTACVAYATVHPHTAESLFRVASRYNMAMLAGKVLMDTNAPDYLLDTNVCKSKDGIEESRRLICKWHKRGRNRYAITPRFAVTSTPHQLAEAGKLHQEFPDTFIQTHLSENRSEIDTVRSLFPTHTADISYTFPRKRNQYGIDAARSQFKGKCLSESSAGTGDNSISCNINLSRHVKNKFDKSSINCLHIKIRRQETEAGRLLPHVPGRTCRFCSLWPPRRQTSEVKLC